MLKIVAMFFRFIPLYFVLLSLVSSSCVTSGKINKVTDTSEISKPKNIVLLIGDGMGLSQVSAGLYFRDSPSNFERFNTIGLIKTSADGFVITDSAAGATAFSTGEKTYNGAIGMTSEKQPAKTIIESLSERGFATGIVVTSSVVHATPASFYAHVDHRYKYEEIAEFLPTSDLDFIAGGGLKFLNNREDKKDLLQELRLNEFEVLETIPSTIGTNKQAVLLAEDGMPKISEGRGDFLPKATQLALEYLSESDKGFFLMVEGSQIDWGGHANEVDYLIEEQLDFDKTIGVVLDFAQKNGETLVIVTADHETGGFTLSMNGSDYNTLKPSFSTGGHSGTMVPVFAEGPGASEFGGIYDNTAIYFKMMKLLRE
jgi:alkaline phosphatase